MTRPSWSAVWCAVYWGLLFLVALHQLVTWVRAPEVSPSRRHSVTTSLRH